MQIQLDATSCSRDTTSGSSWNRKSLPFLNVITGNGCPKARVELEIKNKQVSSIDQTVGTAVSALSFFKSTPDTTLKPGDFLENPNWENRSTDVLVQLPNFTNDLGNSKRIWDSKLTLSSMHDEQALSVLRKPTQAITLEDNILATSDSIQSFYNDAEQQNIAKNEDLYDPVIPSFSQNVSLRNKKTRSKLSHIKGFGIRSPKYLNSIQDPIVSRKYCKPRSLSLRFLLSG